MGGPGPSGMTPAASCYVSQVHAFLYKGSADDIPVKHDMPDTRKESLPETFSDELNRFFALCLLNLVFGALAMAFGMQFIVTAALAMAEAQTLGIFSLVQVLIGWAAAAIGFRWIISSAKILKGVTKIRREFRAMEDPAPAEALTGLIVRMLAHYRANWKTIWRMNLISIVGGAIYIALGVVNILQGISSWYSPSSSEFFYLPAFIAYCIAAGINLAIGLVALLSATAFRRYARAWDRRIIEADRAGEALQGSLEEGSVPDADTAPGRGQE